MGNFVNNVKNNLGILSIPNHLWRTHHHSKITFQVTSDAQKLIDKYHRLTHILQQDSSEVSTLSDDDIEFAFLSLIYRHQAVFNLSQSFRSDLLRRYLFKGELVYAYEPESPTVVLEKIPLTEGQARIKLDQLETKKKQLQKSVNRLVAVKNDVRAYQRKQEKLNQQINESGQKIMSLDKEIQSTEGQKQKTESQSNHAITLISEQESLINNLSREVALLTEKINHTTPIEDFSAEYNLAQDQLIIVSQQLASLQSIYNIYARDSELIRIQTENRRLCAENTALDAKIAELEAKLASSSK